MTTLIVQRNATDQWLRLVSEAEHAAHCQLDQDVESYLVFLLIRYTNQPEIAGSVLALEYLRNMMMGGNLRRQGLRDVGDKCLLYSGLFPRRADRRRVRISYFVDLGRSAYSQLADNVSEEAAVMYRCLAKGFISVMDVLHKMRELGDPNARLAPLHAYELWADTGSVRAYHSLREFTRAESLLPTQNTETKSKQ